MHVVIVGAGIIGTLTAYYLGQSGAQVTVIEKQDEIASATSGANASQLSFSSIYSMASPSLAPTIAEALMGRSTDIRVEKGFDLAFWSWGLSFLWQSTQSKYEHNSRLLRQIAGESQTLYDEIRERYDLQYSYRTTGRLRLYKDQAEMDSTYDTFARLGLEEEGVLVRQSREECVENNKVLSEIADELVGGVLVTNDAVGNTVKFCKGLRRAMEQEGYDVTFRTGTTATNIVRDSSGGIENIETTQGEIKGDCYVICAGAYSRALLASIGHKIKMYPAKGCSMTVPYNDIYGLSDFSNGLTIGRLSIAGLDDGIRLSMGVIFDGYNRAPDAKLISGLKENAVALMPRLEIDDKTPIYTGLRPVTPNSQPVAKRLGKSNTYVNTGHGMWGWTLGPVSSKQIADMITGKVSAS